MIATLSTTSKFRGRRGISALLLVLAWSCVVGCLALALDTALVIYQGRQLQAACEAAALAGAAELLDPVALTPAGLTHWLATGGTAAYSTDHQRLLHRAAFDRAQSLASANRAGGRPVELQLTSHESAASDAIAGVVADPTSIGGPLLSSSAVPGMRSNSLLVRNSRAAERGNPLTLWFGRLVGIAEVDLRASARASLDHRVYGFRPAGHVRVPIVPLVVLTDDHDNEWTRQATTPCQPGTNDRVAIHPSHGSYNFGADGIPEVEVALPLEVEQQEACHARMVYLAPPAVQSASELRRQLLQGYDVQDLAACGGAISLAAALPLVPPGATDRTGIAAALHAARGCKHIWMLGSETDDGRCLLTGFAAGQTVSVTRDAKQLRITVQPCQLVTCTACTGVAGPANPWIGKLLRSE